jgi:hypothetical protein
MKISSFFLSLTVLGLISIGFNSCSHPPKHDSGYQDGREWGMKLRDDIVEDYEVAHYISEKLSDTMREGFQTGFADGFGENGQEIIEIIFEAVETEDFEEGQRTGEKLDEGTVTDILVRDYIVANRVKSEVKRAGWRFGFIIGYQNAGNTYKEGEAVYRSIESSIF